MRESLFRGISGDGTHYMGLLVWADFGGEKLELAIQVPETHYKGWSCFKIIPETVGEFSGETRTISIPVYRDSEGYPICDKCIFLKGIIFKRCSQLNGRLGRDTYNEYLYPHKNCPLWQGELE